MEYYSLSEPGHGDIVGAIDEDKRLYIMVRTPAEDIKINRRYWMLMVKNLEGTVDYGKNQIFWPGTDKVREIYIKPIPMYLPEDRSWLFNLCKAPIYGTELLKTDRVTNMAVMFSGATFAKPDVSNWDTSKVTNMAWMFNGATSANPDVSKWDVSKVTKMDWIFSTSGIIKAD